jgi:hypothetical protein
MNALRISDRTPTSLVSRSTVVPATTPSRPPRRERDFGVGYGNSSGYAAPRPYVANNGPRLFRCA